MEGREEHAKVGASRLGCLPAAHHPSAQRAFEQAALSCLRLAAELFSAGHAQHVAASRHSHQLPGALLLLSTSSFCCAPILQAHRAAGALLCRWVRAAPGLLCLLGMLCCQVIQLGSEVALQGLCCQDC